VHGSEGSIEIGWNASRFRVGNHPWKELPGGRYDKIGSHRRMHECFAGAIAKPAKAEPWISSVEALRTVAAVDAAYRSLETDAWETVDTRALPEQPRKEKKRA